MAAKPGAKKKVTPTTSAPKKKLTYKTYDECVKCVDQCKLGKKHIYLVDVRGKSNCPPCPKS